jgi:hypothetical protein
MVDLEVIQSAYYMVAATGVLVAAGYYIYNLRATLQTRWATIFNLVTAPTLTSEGIKHTNMIQRNQFSNIEEFRELMKNQDFADAYLFWRQTYEHLGTYIRMGMINIEMTARFNSWFHLWMWERFKIVVYEHRKTSGIKNYYYQWEYFYNRLKEYLEKHPEMAPYTGAQ